MDGKSLYAQIVSTVLEMQAKLGSSDGSCTMYYPYEGDVESIRKEFFDTAGDSLGDVEFDVASGRLRITVPEYGCKEISKMPIPKTLEYMISAVRDRKSLAVVKNEIKELFPGSEWTDTDNGEFDAKVTFADDTDPFVYCLHDECGQLIYHRFSKEDYRAFGFR